MRPSTAGLVFGGALAVIGLALLARNLGIIDVSWSVIWPLIIIAAGVAVIIGALRRSGRGTGVPAVVIPLDGSRRLELVLRLGAGRYRLRGGSAALVEAYADEPTIAHRVERRGDAARVRLSTSVDPWAWGWRGGLDWRIGVTSMLPVSLDLQAGAGDFDLDLSALAVTDAALQVGAAELRVVLPRPRGEVPIRAEGGAASLVFVVPPGVEARVAASGLVTASGPRETPGYASARDRVSVTVAGGIASVRLEPGA